MAKLIGGGATAAIKVVKTKTGHGHSGRLAPDQVGHSTSKGKNAELGGRG